MNYQKYLLIQYFDELSLDEKITLNNQCKFFYKTSTANEDKMVPL